MNTLENKKSKYKDSDGFTLEGIYFPNLRTACIHYGIPYSRAYSRRTKSNWSYERIFLEEKEAIKRNRNSFNRYIIYGKEYKTIDDICIEFNVNRKTVAKYTKDYNISVEHFIENIENYIPSKSKKFKVNGIVYNSLTDVCEAYNKNYNMVYRRLYKGWTIEEALDLIRRKIRNKPQEFIIRGRVFKSKSEMCSFYNISTDGFDGRINKGWTIEEALGIVDKKEYIFVDGKKFENKAKIINYFKICRGTLNRRLLKGYSFEEAVGLLPKVSDNIIIKDSYNISSDIKILSYVANDYYKCRDGGKIKYYSKDELFKIRREAFEKGERF